MIVPDQRGHGHSDLSDASRWNLDVWDDDLATLIESLGLERPIVLGPSFGGFVVQHYLARHPDQPGAAVLLATSPRTPSQAVLIERFRQIGGDQAAAAMARSYQEPSLEAEQEWMRFCGPLLTRHPLGPEIEQVQRHQIQTMEVNLHFVAEQLPSMDLRPGLAAARCPVLVVVGEHDPLVPVELSAEIVTALPAGLGELHVLPDAAHQVLSDQPDAMHAIIRGFVEGIPTI